MADESGDKTESPTQRRRDEARRKGQVAYSQELTGSLLLLSGVLSIWLFGEYIAGNLSNVMRIFIWLVP
jgi:flagellar biosynthesis protein FlhB